MHPTRHRLPWEPWEDAFVQEQYALLGLAELSRRMRRTSEAVRHRAYELDLPVRGDRCAQCDVEIVQAATGRPRRFCSTLCQHRSHYEPAPTYPYVCGFCGAPGVAKRPAQYCGDTCSKAAWYQRKRARLADASGVAPV